jgi:hypothetical protein
MSARERRIRKSEVEVLQVVDGIARFATGVRWLLLGDNTTSKLSRTVFSCKFGEDG